MKKFLMLSIDSESYTTLYKDIVDSVDEAVKTLLKRESEHEKLTVVTTEEEGKIRVTLSDGNVYDEYFVVAEIVPLPTKNYCVAWWHAYDGVSFDLKGASDDITEAADQLAFYVKNYVEDKYVPSDYKEGDTSVTCDTGNEWEMLEVLDLREVA